MTDTANTQDHDWWESPLRDDASVDAALAAMSPYAARSALRSPPPGQEFRHERVHDRLIECLAHRLHAIFSRSWVPDEDPVLQANELPMLTGNGACIISLGDAFQGWPTRRMAPFHENTKAGMILGHVDLELTSCWVLRQRLGITDDKAKLALLLDPSSMDLLFDKLITPEHAARNQSFDLRQATEEGAECVEPPRCGPRL